MLKYFVFAALFALTSLFSYRTHANEDPELHRIVPYALTISGGISLGAYEAGLNWALLRYIKTQQQARIHQDSEVYPALVAITGASAGSINGLISAITWCVDETRLSTDSLFSDRINDNLYRQVWVDVGLDQLLPEGPYRDSDGVFTRNAFSAVIQRIKDVLKEKIYGNGCVIPYAMTVTSEIPFEVKVAELVVKNQRHVIPLELHGKNDGSAEFISRVLTYYDNPELGNVIYLLPATLASPSANSYPVNNQTVIDAVLTSSAFPFAFGRTQLDYCRQRSENVTSQQMQGDHICPSALTAERGVFLDGGLFDNIPLGSLKVFAETGRVSSARRVNYIYMDPDNRRKPSATVTKKTPAKDGTDTGGDAPLSYDLLSQAGFLSGAIGTARSYELFKVLTDGGWNNTVSQYTDSVLRKIDAALTSSATNKLNAENCDRPAVQVIDDSLPWEQWLQQQRLALQCENARLAYSQQYAPLSGAELGGLRLKLIEHLHSVDARLCEHSGNSQLCRQQADRAAQKRRSDPLGDRSILLSSRYYLITGQYLANFGAFFDKPFRLFDYYSGIYDAVVDIANYTCRFRNAVQTGSCQVGMVAEQLYHSLQISDDMKADYVFRTLARQEFERRLDSDWRWLNNTPHAPDPQMQAIYLALAQDAKPDANQIIQVNKFENFVNALAENGYQTQDSGDYYLRLTRDKDDWWKLPASRATQRLLSLEKSYEEHPAPEGDKNKSYLKKPLGVLSKFLAGEVLEKHPAVFEIGVNVAPGASINAYWEPSVHIVKEIIAFAKLGGWYRLSGWEGTETVAQASLGLNRIEAQHAIGVGLDSYRSIGGNADYDQTAFGASVNYLYNQRYRITAGLRDFSNNFSDHNWYLDIGYVFY